MLEEKVVSIKNDGTSDELREIVGAMGDDEA